MKVGYDRCRNRNCPITLLHKNSPDIPINALALPYTKNKEILNAFRKVYKMIENKNLDHQLR